jgi:uncharacterized membrane protein
VVGSGENNTKTPALPNGGVQKEIEIVVGKEIPRLQERLQSLTGKKFSDEQVRPIVDELAIATLSAISVRTVRSHIGPLPPPDVIRGYDDIYPGAASQLFRGLEIEQTHRHNLENRALNADIGDSKRKDFISFVTAVVGLIVAGFCIYSGATAIGAILAGAIVLGGAAIWFGREFFASHNKDGTQVKVSAVEKSEKTSQHSSPIKKKKR